MAGERPRAGVDYPRNWHELLEWFADGRSCLRQLKRLRWGAGLACRFCGAAGGGWWQMADGLRRCAACRSETSVTEGTIFAGTRTPLVSWFAAIWYVVNQKQGVSALGLQRVLGFASHQTAWACVGSCAAAQPRAGPQGAGERVAHPAAEPTGQERGGVAAGAGSEDSGARAARAPSL